MEPHLKPLDLQLFKKYLENPEHHYYFEYGSGGSTVYALNCSNIEHVYSVESDKKWILKIESEIGNKKIKDKLQFMELDLHVEPNSWGTPIIDDKPKWHLYSDAILQLNQETIQKINVILIDGRFRVACALKLYQHINDDCIILFDDFFPRPHYHIVLDYYEIIDKSADNNMAVLKKKINKTVPIDLIQKYEHNTD